MTSKKKYIKPEVNNIKVDKSFNLMLRSAHPKPPKPKGDGSKGTTTPFSSPFDDKPFS
jgi:hypothetical protein